MSIDSSKMCQISLLVVDIEENAEILSNTIKFIQEKSIDIAILQRAIIVGEVDTVKVLGKMENYAAIYSSITNDQNSSFIYLVKMLSDPKGHLQNVFEARKARKSLEFTSNRVSIVTVKVASGVEMMFGSALIDKIRNSTSELEEKSVTVCDMITNEIDVLSKYYGHAPVMFVVNDVTGERNQDIPLSSDFVNFFKEMKVVGCPMRVFVTTAYQEIIFSMQSEVSLFENTTGLYCVLNVKKN